MAPKAAEKAPAKKTPAKTAEGSKKKKKVNKAETYKVYIYKVLKQVNRCSNKLPLFFRCPVRFCLFYSMLIIEGVGHCSFRHTT